MKIDILTSWFCGRRREHLLNAMKNSVNVEGPISQQSPILGWLVFACLLLLVAVVQWSLRKSQDEAHTTKLSTTDGLHFEIDINDATAAQLQALPEIGPRLAQRIVEHRDNYGPFSSVDELMEIKGFGPATLAEIQSLLSVSPIESPVKSELDINARSELGQRRDLTKSDIESNLAKSQQVSR